MKMLMKSLFFCLVSLVIFSVSCKKDSMESSTSQADTTVVPDRLKQFAPETQTFTFDPSQAQTFVAKKGTIIKIPAYAFVDENGDTVTTNINITFKEMYQLRDQLTGGLPAVSYDSLLNSDGSFFFSARAQNGKWIRLATSKGITFDVFSDDVDTIMRPFIGNEWEQTIMGSNPTWKPGWNIQELIVDSTWNTKDSVWDMDSSYYSSYFLNNNASDRYILDVFNINRTYLYNIDKYANLNSMLWTMPCTINANATEAIDFTVKLLYKKLGSVGAGSTNGLLNTSAVIQVNDYWAVGQEVTVVVIGVGKTSKKIYYGEKTVEVSAGLNPSISIQPLSDEEFSAVLDKL